MQWYNSKTNELQSNSPWNGYLHPDIIAERYADWQQVADDFRPPVPLEALKQAKWEEIKSKRDTLEQAGVPYMGKVLDSDPVSVQRISIAVQAAQAAITAGQSLIIDWTCADNTVLTMTAEQICGIPVALAMYSDSLHQIARVFREQIEVAQTVGELNAIVWTEQEPL